MNVYVTAMLFEGNPHGLPAFQQECADVGCDGLILGLRDPATAGPSHGTRSKSLDEQCDLFRALRGNGSSPARLIPCPYDSLALQALARERCEEICLPPPVSHQATLVRTAAGFGTRLLAVVNGLGPRGFEEFLKAREGAEATLCYQSMHSGDLSPTLMQLAWLRAQGYPTGLVSDDESELQAAVALGATVIVVSRARVSQADWSELIVRLRRLADTARGIGPRPITQEEMDGVADSIPSLVAARRLERGEIVTSADIDVRPVRQKGLAPFMKEAIIGRRLRYILDAGELFSFGFLEENEHAD